MYVYDEEAQPRLNSTLYYLLPTSLLFTSLIYLNCIYDRLWSQDRHDQMASLENIKVAH